MGIAQHQLTLMSHLVNDALLQPVPVIESDDSVSLACEISKRARCNLLAVRLRDGYGIVDSVTLEAEAERGLEAVSVLTLERAVLLSRGDSTATALSRLNLNGAAMGVVRLGDGLVGVVTTDELKLLL